jgi:hypothetical protein
MRGWIKLIETADIRCQLQGRMIIAWMGNREVGWFTLAHGEGDTYSLHANVCNLARRMGVATFVYDWAEANLPGTLVPFDRLSPEAYQMWQKRRPEAITGYVKDGANYYSPAGLKRWDIQQ